MTAKTGFLTALLATLLLQGCTRFDIQYLNYGPLSEEQQAYSDDSRQEYAVFFSHAGEKLPWKITEPLGPPKLYCKVVLSHNNQIQTEYVLGWQTSQTPVDNHHTYLAVMEFSALNPDPSDRYKGYILENGNFYVMEDPLCRIVHAVVFDKHKTPLMRIPKADITRRRFGQPGS